MNTFFISITILIIVLQSLYISALQRSHLHPGVFSQKAGRMRLAWYGLLRVPGALVAFDIRGMHTLNAVLGYSQANRMLSRLLGVCSTRRDIVATWGGDEFIVFIPYGKLGDANNLVGRLTGKAKELSAEIPEFEITQLIKWTGGIIDGLHLSAAIVEYTRNPLQAAQRAVDETEVIKVRGAKITGRRETTGNKGTLLSVIA
jgi:GGDEF domain-containing protein